MSSLPAVVKGQDAHRSYFGRRVSVTLEEARDTLLRHNRSVTDTSEVDDCERFKDIIASGRHVRSLQGWREGTRSSRPIVLRRVLANHLYRQYRVPLCLGSVWDAPAQNATEQQWCNWFIAVGAGESFYRAYGHDYMSRKACGHFLQSPSGLTVVQSVWFSRVMATGAERGRALSLAMGPIGRKRIMLRAEDTLAAALPFFTTSVAIDTLDRRQVGEIVDFIVANPNFSVAGRSVASVLRLSAEWHRFVSVSKHLSGRIWEATGLLSPWTPSGTNIDDITTERWQVVEVTTGEALTHEGRSMSHCVSSYEGRCASGEVSIWSLRFSRKFEDVFSRRLTIELVGKRDILQVRGQFNRRAKPAEEAVVRAWADANGLRVRNTAFASA